MVIFAIDSIKNITKVDILKNNFFIFFYILFYNFTYLVYQKKF